MTDDVTLGAALRAAREERGLSVEQVSASTRIRATLVRDLEADSLASSGGAVYARGHVKSIASALRVDPAPLLALFDQAHQSAPDMMLAQAEPLAQPVTSFGGSAFAASAAASLQPERHGPRWGLALSAAAASLVAITAIGYAQQSDSPATQAGTLSTLPSATPTPSATPEVQTPNPDSVAAKPPVTGAQLRLRVLGGNSWVSVGNPSGTLFEGLLKDGEFKDFADPSRLKLVVGNAFAVNLNCGGRDSGPVQGKKSVRRFECTAAGLKEL